MPRALEDHLVPQSQMSRGPPKGSPHITLPRRELFSPIGKSGLSFRGRLPGLVQFSTGSLAAASAAVEASAAAVAAGACLLTCLNRLSLLWAGQGIDLLTGTFMDGSDLFSPLLWGQRTVGAHGLDLRSGALLYAAALL